jgi:hypothetical protein
MTISSQGKSVHKIVVKNIVNASEEVKGNKRRAKEQDERGGISKAKKIIEIFISGGIDCFGV